MSAPDLRPGTNTPIIQHEFIAIDEGLGTLLHIHERDPARNWIVPIGKPQARDLQLVGENRVLVGHHFGWTEFDIATGQVAAEYQSFTGVTTVRRQPGGHTLVAGVNLAGLTGVVVLELDANHDEVHHAAYPGDYVRLIRQTPEGTYLMCCNDRIREADRNGQFLRDFPVEGFLHAWKAVRLPGGHLLASAGYGAFLVELDPSGRIVRKLGGKDRVPAKVNPFFFAMFQILPNGHTVVANWQDHGPGHGASGVQLLEFDSRGTIAWQWSRAEMISSLQGVLVLDGLDTSRLHDERYGLMEPMPPCKTASRTVGSEQCQLNTRRPTKGGD